MFPGIAVAARADRAFLGRVVRYLAAEAGIRQFLDIGTGLPAAENTHEVCQAVAAESCVVYADNDPLVFAHARALLRGTPPGVTDCLYADVRDPGTILDGAARTLDFGRPVAIMMLAILNFVPDDAEAQSVVDRLLGAVPPGSYLAVSHPTLELGGEANAEAIAGAMRFWNEHATPPITPRDGPQVARLLGGCELVEPGIVSCSRWRPDPPGAAGSAPEVPLYGAVGRKR
jgi:hypothetical protein